MRWRPGPRLAFALGVLCVCTAAMLVLRPAAAPSFASGVALSTPVPASPFLARTLTPTPDITSRVDRAGVSAAGATATIDGTLSHDQSGCAGARSTVWNPLAGVEYTGRVRIDLPARYGGAIVLFIGDTIPLDIEAETIRGDPLHMHQQRLRPGPGLHIPPDFWLDDENPWSAPGHIIHATIDALPDRDLSFVVSLGRRAPRVIARLIGYAADVRVPVCAVPVRDGELYFATGWYGQHGDSDGNERWMRDVGAVLVYSADGGATSVRLRATGATTTAADPVRLMLRVNDVLDLPALPMQAGSGDYEWNVPDAAWVPGTNELLFSVSSTTRRGTRVFGMALHELDVVMAETRDD